jgi:HK97 family phage portal protein
MSSETKQILSWLNRNESPVESAPESREFSLASLTESEAVSLGLLWDSPVAGVPRMTPTNALTLSAVYRAVTYIASRIAAFPWHVYERVDGGKKRSPNHPLYGVLHVRPNAEMTPFTLWQTVIAQSLTWGTGYAEIVRDGRGGVAEVWPLESRYVDPFRLARTKELAYRIYDSERDDPRVLTERDVLKIQCLGQDGAVGISPIRLARLSLGTAKSVEEYGAGFFGNAARPSGVITFPGELKGEAVKNLRQSFTERYSGARNAGKPLILEQGGEWRPLSLPPEEAQFLQSRAFGIREVARWFGVPPYKLGEDGANRATVEQQAMETLQDTLDPWIVQIQQEVNYKLFAGMAGVNQRYFAELMLTALLRPDAKTRADVYHRAILDGWMNIDDVRSAESMTSLPEGRGQTHYVPQNMMPAPTPDQASELVANIIASKAKTANTAPPGGESGEDGDTNA